jgi:hypothetical protein
LEARSAVVGTLDAVRVQTRSIHLHTTLIAAHSSLSGPTVAFRECISNSTSERRTKKLVRQGCEPVLARVETAIDLLHFARKGILSCIAHVEIVGRLDGKIQHVSLVFQGELQ